MKVMILAHESPEAIALRQNEKEYEPYLAEWFAYGDAMRKAGVYESGQALQEPATATVVTVRDGARRVEDGPFLDAKEQLGGFTIVDVKDMDEALKWAAQCPAAKDGYIDVRAVPYLEDGEVVE